MKSFSREPAVTETDKLVVLAKVLVQTQILECNQFAFGMLWRNKDARRLIRLKDIEELGHNIDNWVTVDARSILIAGWAW